MSTESLSERPKASLGVAKVNNPGVLARAKIMYAAILLAIASFPSPPIAMAAFLALIQAFDTAQEATSSGTKGLATIRNAKRNTVWNAMESLRAYVQMIADTMLPANAAVLIESAGLLVSGVGAHPKPILQAKLMATPGAVLLIASYKLLVGKKSKNVTFNWLVSGDGGKTWSTVPSTPLADTLIPNLTPQLTPYQFKVSVTISRVTGPWTDAVSLVVH
jgi:hypothetical protein